MMYVTVFSAAIHPCRSKHTVSSDKMKEISVGERLEMSLRLCEFSRF